MPAWGAITTDRDEEWNTDVVTSGLFVYAMAAFARRVAERPDRYPQLLRDQAVRTITAAIETYEAFRPELHLVEGDPHAYYVFPERYSTLVCADGNHSCENYRAGAGKPIAYNESLSMIKALTELAPAADPDLSATASEYAATIEWGDGSESTATVSGIGGNFSVSGSHVYAEEGINPITVRITDVDNASNTATATSTASIADAPLSSECATPKTTLPAFTGATARFSDADPGGASSDYTATIEWGDGSESTGTISVGTGPGPYAVSGSHTYNSTGPFTITTTIPISVEVGQA